MIKSFRHKGLSELFESGRDEHVGCARSYNHVASGAWMFWIKQMF
jgi:hypothetical protein